MTRTRRRTEQVYVKGLRKLFCLAMLGIGTLIPGAVKDEYPISGGQSLQPPPKQQLPGRQSTDSDWLQFRGPAGKGIYAASEPLPTELNLQSGLLWKSDVPEGHSSPIVVGDLVIITGFSESQLLVVALDRSDGTTRWRHAIQVASFEKVYHHGPATPTAVSDGSMLFVVFGSYGVLAFDLAGNELWRKHEPTADNLYGTAASPVLKDDMLLVLGSDQKRGVLRAIDKRDGTPIWDRAAEGPASTWSTPVVVDRDDRSLVLIYEPFHLKAVDLKNGEEVWSVPGLADEPITVPQIVEDTILVTSYNMGTNREVIGVPSYAEILAECDRDGDRRLTRDESSANKSVLSRPDADGEGDHPLRMFFRMIDEDRDSFIDEGEWPRMQGWVDAFKHANGFMALQLGEPNQAPTLKWHQERGVPECPTPICLDGLMFAVRNGGVLTIVDTASGVTVFQERLLPSGPYYASPVSGDGKIYFASARGELSVVSAGREPRLLSALDLDESIWATPAISRGVIYIRSKSSLWAFGPQPGG